MSELTRDEFKATMSAMLDAGHCAFSQDQITFWLRIEAHDASQRAKLAQAHEHLEAQRQATYQAVEREHTAKRQLADKDAEIAALKHQLSQLLFFTPGGG